MSVLHLPLPERGQSPSAGAVDIVVPVHNEEEQLATSVTALHSYLDTSFPFPAAITIADNASVDGTWAIASELATSLDRVRAIRLDRKGRGRALRTAWSTSTAEVVAYMDVDLATGLDALLPLVAPLLSGHSDVAIGSRLASGAHVVRRTKREFISRGYNLLVRTALRSGCTDAQCGFKAMRREAAMALLPLVADDEWFFDTEVLVTAHRIGLRIHEVPVDWVDDLDSRVDIVHTAVDDLRGVVRMLGPTSRSRTKNARVEPGAPPLALVAGPEAYDGAASGAAADGLTRSGHKLDGAQGEAGEEEVFSDELLRFAGVGMVSTVAYAALFGALQPRLGSYVANTVAVGACSLGNTAAHRGMAGGAAHGLDRPRRVAVGSTLFGVSLGFSTAALATTRAAGLTSLAPQLAAVTVANMGAAVIRFAILRSWVFRPRFGTHVPTPVPATSTR